MQKILIVDDEKIMLMLARRILSKKYAVVVATSGSEAIKLFESEQPDLVLSDLLMPEMDGYELHKTLQEKSEEPVPIIFMTADESAESESRGFEVGAADYIRKPLKPDVLLRRVGNILDNLDKIHGLKTAASTDQLTGLLNKHAAQDEISNLLEKTTGALLMLDLDGFKLVNDIHGHAMGDKILSRFADLIRKIIRESDLAGRMGGDEFAVYLQNVHDEKILRDKTIYLNEQLLAAAKKLMGEDIQIPLGVSVGVVFCPDEGRNFSELYKKADAALYNVKKNSKHGYAIYGFNHATQTATENISQLRMILNERTVEKGAYFVGFESFQTIYRLLVRMVDNYQKGLQLIQFTVGEEKFVDQFKEILTNSLRKSDCVTQSGKSTFLVLLMEAKSEECEIVKNRILDKIKNVTDFEISYSTEKIF
ncbi:MAG: diguanylate cyclase [Selenomonadaceae bacterium]|nr:diguanylate cyclase [Selenomonadaceae bacterium]